MKRKALVGVSLGLLLVLVLVLLYIFKPMTMNDIYDEPNFAGVVTAVDANSLTVAVNEGEDELKCSDIMRVSLVVERKDSMTKFSVGDQVKVFYDGTIQESYPAQINTVYAILLENE